jgi:hypothetical protein
VHLPWQRKTHCSSSVEVGERDSGAGAGNPLEMGSEALQREGIPILIQAKQMKMSAA